MLGIQRLGFPYTARSRRSAEQSLIDLIASLGPFAYWPLDDLAGPALNHGSLGAAADAAYNGPTLASVVGPGGIMAPAFDGINDFVNVYSAALAAAYLGGFKSTATVLFFWKVFNAGVWTDGAFRECLRLAGAGYNDYIIIRKYSTANTFSCERLQPGATIQTAAYNNTNWNMLTATWDTGANQFKNYMNNDAQFGATGGASNFTNALQAIAANIGAAETAGNEPWFGSLAHIALFDRVILSAERSAVFAKAGI